MASDCAVDTARSAAICSPSSSTPRSPPTTTAVNANCGPPRPTARSPAAAAPNGARTCSPPSAPSSAPHSDAEWTPIRRSKPPYTAAQRSNRVEQILPGSFEVWIPRKLTLRGLDQPAAETAADQPPLRARFHSLRQITFRKGLDMADTSPRSVAPDRGCGRVASPRQGRSPTPAAVSVAARLTTRCRREEVVRAQPLAPRGVRALDRYEQLIFSADGHVARMSLNHA